MRFSARVKVAVCVLSLGFASCVVLKEGERVENPPIFGYVVQEAKKIAFDTKKVPESSGVESLFGDSRTFISHGDSFCPPFLYRFRIENDTATDYERFRLQGALPLDTEDIAAAWINNKPILFFGDIGDNWRFRLRKTVFAVTQLENGKATVDRRIRFRCRREGKTVYADSEALFFYRGDLYLLTKNRGSALLFCFPAEGARYVDALCLGSFPVASRITSAAVNRQQSRLAVLTLEFLYLFEIDEESGIQNLHLWRAYSVAGCRQCEGVCFTENGDIVITNEQGDLYLLEIGKVLHEKSDSLDNFD